MIPGIKRTWIVLALQITFGVGEFEDTTTLSAGLTINSSRDMMDE